MKTILTINTGVRAAKFLRDFSFASAFDSVNYNIKHLGHKIREEDLTDVVLAIAHHPRAFPESDCWKSINYIKSRNNLISIYDLDLLYIDVLMCNGGLIRNSKLQKPHNGLKQLDHIGSVGTSSISQMQIEEFPLLTDYKNKQLDEWINIYTNSTKANIITKQDIYSLLKFDTKKRMLFCPLQITTDYMVRVYAPYSFGVTGFMQSVINNIDMSQYEIVFREHPDHYKFNPGPIYTNFTKQFPATILPYNHPLTTPMLLYNCDAVAAINSTSSCEALLFNKPVIRWGNACHKQFTINGVKEGWNDKMNNLFCSKAAMKEYINNCRRFLHYLIFVDSWNIHSEKQHLIDLLNKKCKYHRYDDL